MINLKKRLLKKGKAETELPVWDKSQRIQIATCVLLLELAKSDDEFSSLEKKTVTAILRREFQISEEVIEELMEIARRKREESIDLWEFTHLINKNYSREDKIRVIENAWKVIYADKKLDKYEDHLIHKLARLLGLRHSELIERKLKVLDKVERRSEKE
jgi:uncharacterized tellurite resistance protein B-like protein